MNLAKYIEEMADKEKEGETMANDMKGYPMFKLLKKKRNHLTSPKCVVVIIK